MPKFTYILEIQQIFCSIVSSKVASDCRDLILNTYYQINFNTYYYSRFNTYNTIILKYT